MTTSARIWREKPQRYRLEANACKGCGKVFFPPRLVCSACGGREFTPTSLPGKGKVVTFTVIHTPPTAFDDESPYAMAVVELENGARIFAQLVDVDPDSIAIGMAVKTEFRKIQQAGLSGVLCYGYKFVPDVSA
ncbi:MAG TPA: Zn-ribbon domain-containing OB-fold protein [Thermoanaerobaculia bacterium]|nr:Zn-ribbon domain-containing OB-fold protein [Thermoanaerobaculia bacterium]HUM29020.1 Zn-ribbon domain-containing OB-fold protein [Thermoanaerobaculia bacterium]HXK67424.1 Zn-ribbon domain-containing OB-fold protein [Thermoanaerobaculia bacterium]